MLYNNVANKIIYCLYGSMGWRDGVGMWKKTSINIKYQNIFSVFLDTVWSGRYKKEWLKKKKKKGEKCYMLLVLVYATDINNNIIR